MISAARRGSKRREPVVCRSERAVATSRGGGGASACPSAASPSGPSAAIVGCSAASASSEIGRLAWRRSKRPVRRAAAESQRMAAGEGLANFFQRRPSPRSAAVMAILPRRGGGLWHQAERAVKQTRNKSAPAGWQWLSCGSTSGVALSLSIVAALQPETAEVAAGGD